MQKGRLPHGQLPGSTCQHPQQQLPKVIRDYEATLQTSRLITLNALLPTNTEGGPQGRLQRRRAYNEAIGGKKRVPKGYAMLLEKDKAWVAQEIDSAICALAEVFKQKLLEKDQRIEALEAQLAVLNTTLATSLDVSKEKILEKDHQIEALEARLSDLNPPPTLSPSPQMSLPPEKLPPGVSRHRTKYRARRKGQYLGVFDTIDKAQAAYEASAAYETSGNGGTAQGTQQNSVVPGGNVPGPSGTFQELSGTSGTTQGTSGPSGNEEGTGGELPGSR